MTCFWKGILKNLSDDDFKKYNINKPKNKDFVIFLKNHNSKTINVEWNNQKLSQKQLEENFTHIKDFDSNSINEGYLCSTCEPFLFLVSHLFEVNINHNYCGHLMKYKINDNSRLINFNSNKSHFSG